MLRDATWWTQIYFTLPVKITDYAGGDPPSCRQLVMLAQVSKRCDRGYTAKYIAKLIRYPMLYTRVRQRVWITFKASRGYRMVMPSTCNKQQVLREDPTDDREAYFFCYLCFWMRPIALVSYRPFIILHSIMTIYWLTWLYMLASISIHCTVD